MLNEIRNGVEVVLVAQEPGNSLEAGPIMGWLTRNGNRGIFLSDGEQVVSYLSEVGDYGREEQHPRPSVLLLDLTLPGRTAFEILQWLGRARLEGMFVVVTSWWEDAALRRKAYELGAHLFIPQPLRQAHIDAILACAVVRRKGFQEQPIPIPSEAAYSERYACPA